MEKLSTNNDAELILKLYELRTEPTMREARNWITTEFWPNTAEEFFAVQRGRGTKENAYLRQVTSYWEMAAPSCFMAACPLSSSLIATARTSLFSRNSIP